MSKRNIQIVIAFSFLALFGTVGIQYYWVNKIYQQNLLLFEQNIQQALKFAANSLQKREHIYQTQDFFTNGYDKQRAEIERQVQEAKKQVQHTILLRTEENEEMKTLIQFNDLDSIKSNIVVVGNHEPKKEKGYSFVSFVDVDSVSKATIRIEMKWDSVVETFESKADSLIKVLEYRTFDIKNEQKELEATVDQLVWEMDEWSRPFSDSIPQQALKEIIEKTIQEYQLPTDYDFAIIDNQNDDEIVFSSANYQTDHNDFTYFTNLFPYELISRQKSLSLQFNNNPLFVKMSGPILLSMVFTLILILGFVLIIFNLVHHRKVSEMKSDFINNMTHEFKTPIATISLASDSILTPSVLQNQEKVSYFTGMIKKENKRMNRLVEKILQMARLENKELELDMVQVNVHELLEMILENTQVKLNGDGQISAELKAKNFMISADKDHFTNVIYNLIDNAIKYSDKPAQIEISTRNLQNMLCLEVKDHGKGMNKKEIQYIFDRFYRIESGNVHNVKGYGLGLTYVKAIIEKHKGQIIVKSEPNLGSSFEIRIPMIK